MSTRHFEDGGAAPVGSVCALAGSRRRKPLDPVLLERVAETGFLATEFGLDDHAERIFLALAKLKPGRPSPRIALAMVQARRGRVDEAIAALCLLLEEHPESDLARAVLGTMLVHARRPFAEGLLDDVVMHSQDQSAISVAKTGLEQLKARAVDESAASEAVALFRHHNTRA